jgi:hypothetical protein
MIWRGVLLTVGISLGALVSPLHSQTLDGMWRSKSGTVYRFSESYPGVVATYEQPNPAQAAAGIQPGDLALKGNYISNVLVGTFYQRAPLDVQAACPQFKIIDSPIQWELSGDVLTGTLLLIGGTDNACAVTQRMLQQMRLERAPAPSQKVQRPPLSGPPVPWPLPW